MSELIISLIFSFSFLSLVARLEYLLEGALDELSETFRLLVALFDHRVDHSHDEVGIVPTLTECEVDARLVDQVAFYSALVFDLGEDAPQG